MKQYYRIILTLGFIILFFFLLKFPQDSVHYAFTGLTLWFQKMIPTLFPFMVISGMIIRMNLTEYFAALFAPIFRPLFHVSSNGVYCILLGFLCGFPMGAKVAADLYMRERISKEEAEFLLCFCNNIGPIYFVSFVMPLLGLSNIMPYIVGMYGIPLLYGIILVRIPPYKNINQVPSILGNNFESSYNTKIIKSSMLEYLDESIMSGIENITKLGAYMILFNLMNIIPAMVLPCFLLPYINGLLEITSGINRLGGRSPLAVLLLLPFGGLSCIAQTYSIIKETDLSIKKYFVNKVLLTMFTACYYFVLLVVQMIFCSSPFLFG